jgi:hypothetical protein
MRRSDHDHWITVTVVESEEGERVLSLCNKQEEEPIKVLDSNFLNPQEPKTQSRILDVRS